MARNDPQVAADGRGTATANIKLPGCFCDVVAPEQFGGAFRNEFVARAMKTPTPNTGLMPSLRHGVTSRFRRRPLIKSRLKQSNQKNTGQPLSEQPDAGDIRRIMSRGDAVEGF